MTGRKHLRGMNIGILNLDDHVEGLYFFKLKKIRYD